MLSSDTFDNKLGMKNDLKIFVVWDAGSVNINYAFTWKILPESPGKFWPTQVYKRVKTVQ